MSNGKGAKLLADQALAQLRDLPRLTLRSVAKIGKKEVKLQQLNLFRKNS